MNRAKDKKTSVSEPLDVVREVVVMLSRDPLDASTISRVRELLAGGVDWNALYEKAEQWRVEPLVLRNLEMHFSDAMPPEVRSEVDARSRISSARTIGRTFALLELTNALDNAQIPVVVLKGPAVGMMAYGDVSLRRFDDFDLLVHRSDLGRAKVLLISRGYAPLYHADNEELLVAEQLPLEFSNGHHHVELHWALFSRNWRIEVDHDHLWSTVGRIECLGSSMTSLSRQHMFLYLCAHGAKHEWIFFRWVADVAQLATRLSPVEAEKVMTLAGQTHCRRILTLALRIVRDAFGPEPSSFSENALGDARDTEHLVVLVRAARAGRAVVPNRAWAWGRRAHPYFSPYFFVASARERRLDRVMCVARVLLHPTETDRDFGPFRWVTRPIRLAFRALRAPAF